MGIVNTAYSFGIEEEYYLVNARTRALAKAPPRRLISALKSELGGSFSEEFMRSQIEICTPVCTSSEDARTALSSLRSTVARQARRFGLAPIAAATHPFSLWRHQRHRNNARYNAIAEDFQALGRRMLISGLHVHIGVENPDNRIALINDLRPWLPLFLALSGSSPFWGGEVTGLKSYRTVINDMTPRKGIPEPFENWQHFEETIAPMIEAGVIGDATKIWWDVRPSVRFPTIEVRIMDVCPSLDDAVALASLLRCLCRYLDRTRPARAHLPDATAALCAENRWRAQRYGLAEGLIDSERGELVPIAVEVEALLDLVAEDAQHFGCADDLDHVRTIVARGTSADQQLALFERLRGDGVARTVALAQVVDHLIEQTVDGVEVGHDERCSDSANPTGEFAPV